MKSKVAVELVPLKKDYVRLVNVGRGRPFCQSLSKTRAGWGERKGKKNRGGRKKETATFPNYDL